MRIVVDLPEPFGPRKPKTLPRGEVEATTSSTAVNVPNLRVTSADLDRACRRHAALPCSRRQDEDVFERRRERLARRPSATTPREAVADARRRARRRCPSAPRACRTVPKSDTSSISGIGAQQRAHLQAVATCGSRAAARSYVARISCARADAGDASAVEEGDARGVLGLVHVRRGDDDRQAVVVQLVAAAPRTRGATPDRRRSSARRAAADRGCVSSAATSASFCFMPPDSAPARRAPEAVHADALEQVRGARVGDVVRHAVELRAQPQVLVDRQVLVHARTAAARSRTSPVCSTADRARSRLPARRRRCGKTSSCRRRRDR